MIRRWWADDIRPYKTMCFDGRGWLIESVRPYEGQGRKDKGSGGGKPPPYEKEKEQARGWVGQRRRCFNRLSISVPLTYARVRGKRDQRAKRR